MQGARSSNILGKYRLIAELGQGGMAEVYLAVAQGPGGFNKLTVIKQIRPQLAEEPEFLAMFLDEARLAARLNHPNVVQTNEVGHDGSRYFIAMEYLEGQPLNRLTNRLGRDRIPLSAHLRVLADALAGLHYAHDLTDYDGTPMDVVHRDVTPHNLFLTYDGQVKVVDFGIAKAMDSSAETRTGVLKGKISYMAPEQARGERVDRRADIFAMGVMLWEAAVGQRLWSGIPDMAILARIANGDVPTPRAARPDVHPELEAIIMRAMAHRREDRHRTAGELQADIERFIDRLPERVNTRELGRLVAHRFDEERGKIRALVDAQLRDARALPTDEYRAVELPRLTQRSNSMTPPSMSGAGQQPVADYGSWRSYRQPGSLTAASTATSATAHTAATPAARPRGLLLAIAAAGGAGLAAAVWLLARGTSTPQAVTPPQPTAVVAAAAQVPSTPPAPSAKGEIALKVTARPGDARFFLDDAPLAGNPISHRAPRDGAKHRLRVEAAGYRTETRELSFDNDFDIELVLERETGGALAAPAAVRGAPAAAKPAVTEAPEAPPPEEEPQMKRGGAKPVRQIDTTNPFANP
ncbi:serine/threonine protein kinase [Chondromyces apiculatus]|uniref:Serine/threonine protein kinase Pkn7 n=1 Tax=Chondromyces apiculatus DSM 436 TaxID=1192034 RepID=A0A017T9E6_9BACT|nr:serine/threonine-protein kinase [Chondromyces apiculatus]EYF05440.1 serine/threonine protein kinase Pkn7 [Chondromyces apiculatus DSM 436]